MLPQELIRKKRDGGSLTPQEIEFLVQGIVDGGLSEGQIAAFAMAVFFRDLAMEERIALTGAMARSGRTLDWSGLDLPGPLLDKHSTGGVGDKVSLMLAPLVAACGGFVPMISGRGLGHTGGTLDKLEAIPGYDTRPDPSRFRHAVREVGCAIIGQTEDLAPADRRLYAIRDVTATVESVALITASILSKKLAAGLEGLILDVKVGSGAFMKSRAEARALARSLVAVARGTGLPTVACLTSMQQVLGTTAGNALEVAECLDYLARRHREPRLHRLVLALAAEMLLLGGLVSSREDGEAAAQAALDSGEAAERFARMVRDLGGPADLLERPRTYLPEAAVVRPCPPPRPGRLAAMDARQVGLVVVGLGGGRVRPADSIDHRVGLSEVAAIGDLLDATRPFALVHAADEAAARRAIVQLQDSLVISEEAAPEREMVLERIAGETVS